MKNHKCRWALIIGIISAVAALSAALTAFYIFTIIFFHF